MRIFSLAPFFVLAVPHVWCAVPGAALPQDGNSAPASPEQKEPASALATADGLIRLAADAAAKMPLQPHIKTRSRLQAELVDAALAAGEVATAEAILPRIANWRRALAQASIAAHHAEAWADAWSEKADEDDAKEAASTALAALARAEELEAGLTDEFEQGWRRDRVRAGIARAYALLGDIPRAAAIQSRLESSEAGRLAPLSVRFTGEEHVDSQLETLLEIGKGGDFDQVQSSLASIAALYGRFATTTEARDRFEDAIRQIWMKLPLLPRIETLEALIEHDLERGDVEHAKALVAEVESMIKGHRWNLEDELALHGRAARLRFLSGGREKALAHIEGAMAAYDEQRDTIFDIYRVDALLPIAEAYVLMGEAELADALFQRASAEAIVNPNSRPRTENLVALCTAIARSGHVPSKSLRGRLLAVSAALGDPW